MQARKGVGHGDRKLVDHLTHEGLTVPFKHISMGLCAEKTAAEMNITRKDQDDYCKLSFQRHMDTAKNGLLDQEIVPVSVPSKGKPKVVSKDEECLRYKEDMI